MRILPEIQCEDQYSALYEDDAIWQPAGWAVYLTVRPRTPVRFLLRRNYNNSTFCTLHIWPKSLLLNVSIASIRTLVSARIAQRTASTRLIALRCALARANTSSYASKRYGESSSNTVSRARRILSNRTIVAGLLTNRVLMVSYRMGRGTTTESSSSQSCFSQASA